MKIQELLNHLNSNAYKGIIFDFDNTLYDLAIDWKSLTSNISIRLSKEFGINNPMNPYIESMEQLKLSNNDVYLQVIEYIDKIEKEGFEKGNANNKLIEYIHSQNDKKFALFSMNTNKTIQKFVETYNLKHKFNVVITQQNCIKFKPSGEDLLYIKNLWKYDAGELVYVGNNEYDEESGKMADIRTFLIEM